MHLLVLFIPAEATTTGLAALRVSLTTGLHVPRTTPYVTPDVFSFLMKTVGLSLEGPLVLSYSLSRSGELLAQESRNVSPRPLIVQHLSIVRHAKNIFSLQVMSHLGLFR